MPRQYKPEVKDRKRYENLDGTTLKEVLNLAKKKTGWGFGRIARQIGVSDLTMRQWRHRGVKSSSEIPKLIEVTRLAGFSDPHGIVIILRHMIPTELADLQQYVGCTVRLYRRKERVAKFMKRAPEEHAKMMEAIPRAKD